MTLYHIRYCDNELFYCLSVKIFEKKFCSQVTPPPPLKNQAAPCAAFIFSMVERSRKTSLHCAKRNFTQNRRFSSHLHKISEVLLVKSFSDRACALRSSGSIRYRFTCEEVSSAAVKFLPSGSKVGDVITARLRRLNFPYTLPNATFSTFPLFSIHGSRPRPKLLVSRRRI